MIVVKGLNDKQEMELVPHITVLMKEKIDGQIAIERTMAGWEVSIVKVDK